jgi:hypothetical protein
MPNKESVYSSAVRFEGLPHGDDANGLCDIEFPDINRASSWAAGWSIILGDGITLREPVADLASPVVLQVQL